LIFLAAFLMRARSATDVPPNFITKSGINGPRTALNFALYLRGASGWRKGKCLGCSCEQCGIVRTRANSVNLR
jgi:hypothetical protein